MIGGRDPLEPFDRIPDHTTEVVVAAPSPPRDVGAPSSSSRRRRCRCRRSISSLPPRPPSTRTPRPPDSPSRVVVVVVVVVIDTVATGGGPTLHAIRVHPGGLHLPEERCHRPEQVLRRRRGDAVPTTTGVVGSEIVFDVNEIVLTAFHPIDGAFPRRVTSCKHSTNLGREGGPTQELAHAARRE